MIALLLVLVLAAVTLWSVSLGAVLQVRRERRRDLATACPAWVPLAGRDDRLYRCGVPLRPGRSWCGTHASARDRDAARTHPDAQRIEQTRQWADARAKMRWGIPMATAVVVGTIVVAGVWLA